jgi:alpha-L-fucosidase
LLAKVAGRDGNLLLNVGPAPDGKIDPAQVARLREIGDWLGRYGASIYGTRGGPFLPGDYGTATFRDKTIYLHIINWPGEKLTMPAIAAKVVRATAMTGGTVTVFQSDHNLELSMTLVSRSDMDTGIVLELDRPANALTPLEVKLASNSSGSR